MKFFATALLHSVDTVESISGLQGEQRAVFSCRFYQEIAE
jgi:hypothetical protein